MVFLMVCRIDSVRNLVKVGTLLCNLIKLGALFGNLVKVRAL